MDGVKTSHGLESAQADFDLLLNNLTKVLAEIRPRTNILNTKLGKLKEDLSNIEELDSLSLSKVAELVVKYNAINSLFVNNIQYDKNDLIKIIEGKADYSIDSNEKYNDYVFELSMGIRFFKAFKGQPVKVDLNGVCDVIIDGIIAIECKYIHSIQRLKENISKAKKQIECRVNDKQAEFGFVALDLSHVYDHKKVQDFANYTFEHFVRNYEILKGRNRIEGDVLESIINDNNFNKIISSYMMNEVETSMYAEIGFSYDLGKDVLAIMFQVMNSLVFEYQGKKRPTIIRGLTYFINSDLEKEKYLSIKSFLSQLQVGI
ncbi:hypothetical protein [Pantoea coffeiphila]|uniref:Uncharacterized protein n=1 Tax=Pantoea coffeiphila TaxID=1465635 RepID=A0A2S9IFF3_9GAMM|nr:hypothetical protein [Pantoea coffeiphila]PRD16521.1 hypothetical protein CQW29_06885 [Pantoea coffeiphila]